MVKSFYLIFFSWWKSNFILKINNYISNNLFKKYIFSPYSYFFNKNSSEFIRNIYSESRYINQSIDAYFKLAIEVFSILIILLVLLTIQFESTLLIASFFIPFVFIFNLIFSKRIKDWGFKKQYFVAKILQDLQQSFSSIKEIILRGNQNFFKDQFGRTIFNLNNQTKKLMFISEIPKNLLETIAVCLICIIIFSSFQEVKNFSELAPIVGLFGAAALRVIPAFNRIIAYKQNIDSCYPSVKLVYKELNEASFEEVRKNPIERKFRFENEIELKNIEYIYPKTNNSVFKELNLKIKKNECICLIGDSGSGKTTIVDLISGLLEPQKGEIFIDGKKTSLYNADWRKLIGYVTQSVYLIDDTIKKNILFGLGEELEFNKERFDRSIKYSQLDSLIKKLPEGIDYKVGENGIKLSGGQRQRIAIARTLYLNPKILILDEITSSLDEMTAKSLLESLNNLSGKITMIYISHNNTVINNANIVYKINKDENNKIKLLRISNSMEKN
jgi:ABC-type multidrug transport system fused ATPase/permease subunit